MRRFPLLVERRLHKRDYRENLSNDGDFDREKVQLSYKAFLNFLIECTHLKSITENWFGRDYNLAALLIDVKHNK